jgi:hypothetical protein
MCAVDEQKQAVKEVTCTIVKRWAAIGGFLDVSPQPRQLTTKIIRFLLSSFCLFLPLALPLFAAAVVVVTACNDSCAYAATCVTEDPHPTLPLPQALTLLLPLYIRFFFFLSHRLRAYYCNKEVKFCLVHALSPSL